MSKYWARLVVFGAGVLSMMLFAGPQEALPGQAIPDSTCSKDVLCKGQADQVPPNETCGVGL
jgi:hypothetical protein